MTEKQAFHKWLKVMAFLTIWVLVYAITLAVYVPGWLFGMNFLLFIVYCVVSARELL